jgi:Ca2+-dependent lipid-binding protein
VTLALLGRTLNLPLTLRNLQVFAHTRVTLTPLLSEYPFAGSARFTLLSPPHVDFDLPVTLLGRTLDVMAFPLVPSLVSLGVKIGCHLVCGYPKSLQVELVEGGGRDKGPVGMLVVRVVKAAGLRSEDLVGHSDPYCVLQVRAARGGEVLGEGGGKGGKLPPKGCDRDRG